MEKIKEGQKIYIVNISSIRSISKEPIEVTVTKVGKKFFTIDHHNERFYLENHVHDNGQYSASYKVFSSLEQYEEKKEFDSIYDELKKIFGGYVKADLSLNQLREINKIIKQ